ncbi:MAG: hypothetical protein LBP95_08915 [Deltaproteobacteria bacterium]|jgi:hypothetical protein|nr:hypothetical protein [Deltaproteobacteria bacterium]
MKKRGGEKGWPESASMIILPGFPEWKLFVNGRRTIIRQPFAQLSEHVMNALNVMRTSVSTLALNTFEQSEILSDSL